MTATRATTGATALPLGVEARRGPLTADERRATETYGGALLAWQRAPAVSRWPRWAAATPALPLATAFVSLGHGGELRGSMGSSEGDSTAERICRAFFAALHDPRARPLVASERGELSLAVSFLHTVRPLRRSDLATRFEAGTHGLGAREPGKPPVVLLPEFASSSQMSLERTWQGLVQKNGADFSDAAQVYIFESTRVVSRPYAKPRAQAAVNAAAAWLAGMVQANGRFLHEVDPRTGIATDDGPLHHARSATALQALQAHGGFPQVARRAHRWLRAEVRAGVAGEAVRGWPSDPAQQAASVALASLAGLDLQRELMGFAQRPEVIASAWHAPQVAAALGSRCSPDHPLWQACTARLEASPWAPWTACAAHRIGDAAAFRRATAALVASVTPRRAASAPGAQPHAGGVGLPRGDGSPGVPETALTALVAEALAPSTSKAARRAARTAISFVRARQFCDATTPLLVDPRTSEGAFAATPVDPRLRVDVVGHALLALLSLPPPTEDGPSRPSPAEE